MIAALPPVVAVAVAGAAGAAVGAVSPRLARLALDGGRPADGLDARPLDPAPGRSPLPGLGRGAAVVAAVVTGVLAALVVAGTPPARIPLALLLLAVAPALALADLAAHRLPDRATGTAALAAAALALVAGGAPLLAQAAGCGAAAALLLAALSAATGGGIGGGDVKLAGALGLALGQLGPGQVALGLAAGVLLGGVAAVALLAGGRARASTALPFGPWLLLGAFLVAAAPAGVSAGTLAGAQG